MWLHLVAMWLVAGEASRGRMKKSGRLTKKKKEKRGYTV
jgi:hypothetical protein